jgi:hypothetical protein
MKKSNSNKKTKYNQRINLLDIGHIKTIKDLKKYKINAPIINNNYLFHYLILTNNLDALKLYTHPIYRYNSDGLDGFMLAAKEKKYDILDYFIKNKKYNEYLYLKNKKNMNFLYYMDPEDKEYYNIIKENDFVDWDELFQQYANTNLSSLDILLLKGKYKTIKYIIKNIDIDYKSYMSQPYHFNLLLNTRLDKDNMIDLLDLLESVDNNILKYTDDMGYDISHAIILQSADDMSLLKYIIKKRGDDMNRFTPISASHIFITAYKLGVKNNDFKLAQYIYDNVISKAKNDIEFEETDMHGNTIVHFILKIRADYHKGNYSLEKAILSNFKHWNRLNMDKKSALDYIIKLDYDKYHKFVSFRPEILPKKEMFSNSKWIKYITSLPINMSDNDYNVNILETPYAHSNMFQARFTDIGIFSQYLKEKYKNILYIPHYKGHDVSPDWDDDMMLPDNMLKFNNNFPWIIIWNNEDSFWIHPHLNMLINKNKDKYKAAIVFLSMRLPDGGLHAGLIFYDFTNKIIERFDPYGNTTILDGYLDEKLKEKLTDGTHMKYCSPECYFPVSGFQTLSDENNIMNQKMGDFGGYCLAWCIWYVEHKLTNMNVKSKDLVRKTLNRFMSMNIKPMGYIRNYANYISKFRLGYLKKIGIPENITSNENLNNTYNNIINNNIIKLYN